MYSKPFPISLSPLTLNDADNRIAAVTFKGSM